MLVCGVVVASAPRCASLSPNGLACEAMSYRIMRRILCTKPASGNCRRTDSHMKRTIVLAKPRLLDLRVNTSQRFNYSTYSSDSIPNKRKKNLSRFDFIMSQTSATTGSLESGIEVWKIKKLIKRLSEARGNGTSMISLIIPPKDQISRVSKMLADEQGAASNIKSRVNRQSVLSAITSTQQRLKLYNKVLPNGLVIYCGEIKTTEDKVRKINIDLEPFKPINTSLYECGSKFNT